MYRSTAGYELLAEDGDTLSSIINNVQQHMEHKGATRYDMLTYATAKNYIEQQHPKVVFIGLGETDEFAHKVCMTNTCRRHIMLIR